MSMDGVDIFGGLDDLIDKEKETILPLIIDGLEVDREVSVIRDFDRFLLQKKMILLSSLSIVV